MNRVTDLHFLSSPSVLQDEEHPLLVLLHGFGSDERDLMAIRPYIDPKWAVVTIRAPFREGSGFRWYALKSLQSPDFDEMAQALALLKKWFGGLALRFPHVPPHQVIVGGFSQGAVMALHLGLYEPLREIGGVSVLSGYLPNPPSPNAAWRRLPIFWGHGLDDQILPYALAQTAHDILSRHNIAITFRSYTMGHEVIEEELHDLMDWLDGVVK
ncbi:alpha/beta hydrolase [Sulfobacillus thermosulfidooxidans]|uniref:alpha/beta hydrolase n=1 Tax=Sulfobacillus thermosulfidooxidans TaxID=28034 RepID=UPI0006B69388|nr:alpha/beta fold hydrolase [Sulfobacillus thermosulfidooxidans]